MEEELIKIWQSSPQQEQVKFERSRLMMDVQSHLDRFHRSMKWLYFRESLSAFIAIPVFGYFAFQATHVISQIGAALIALWAAYLLLVVKQTKQKNPDGYAMDYLQYLRKTKDYLELQMKLRLNIFYWYVLPFLTFCYLFMLGVMLEKSNDTMYILGAAIYCLVIGTAIYFLNRRSARKVVGPKLEKVVGLISAMES